MHQKRIVGMLRYYLGLANVTVALACTLSARFLTSTSLSYRGFFLAVPLNAIYVYCSDGSPIHSSHSVRSIGLFQRTGSLKKNQYIIFFFLAGHSALYENILVNMYTYCCYLRMLIFILTIKFIVILRDSVVFHRHEK